jgi:hypothetical protein
MTREEHGKVGVVREAKIIATNPTDIRKIAQNWSLAKKERFDIADKFYNKVGFNNYDNHLRGINFDKDVKITILNENEYVYQYCYIDDIGEPKIGNYYYKNENIDVSKLGFDVEDRVIVRIKLKNSTEFLESNAANIEDWSGSPKIFEGGETQLFSPNVEFSEVTILIK